MVGVGLTSRLTVLVVKQPKAVAPVTEYTVVAAGLTETEAPLRLPGIQVYDTAPEEVSVELKPGQIAVGEATAVSVGP